MLLRPVSGSGALAAATELIGQYGPDSYIGRTAAVMLGSTETTFYVIAVYFGAAGIKRTRWAVPAALCADITASPFPPWPSACSGGAEIVKNFCKVSKTPLQIRKAVLLCICFVKCVTFNFASLLSFRSYFSLPQKDVRCAGVFWFVQRGWTSLHN